MSGGGFDCDGSPVVAGGRLVMAFKGARFDVSCADTKVPIEITSKMMPKIPRKCETLFEISFSPNLRYIETAKNSTSIITDIELTNFIS